MSPILTGPSTESAHHAQPQPPFHTWPIQFRDPEVGFAWYTSAATLVTQVIPKHASARVSAVLSDWVDMVREKHQDDIARHGGLLGIHDWRSFRTYDTEARRLWLQRIERRPKGYLRKGVIIISDSPLIKMAVAGANLIVALASGGKSQFEIATDAAGIVDKYNVQRPRA